MAIQFSRPVAKSTVRKAGSKAAHKPKRAGGRPKSDNPKAVLNIRVDADVLEAFRASGPGWQARINELLRSAIKSPTR